MLNIPTNNTPVSAPSQQLPGYLTRLLLALHEEKHALQEYLGPMSMFMTPNRHLFQLRAVAITRPATDNCHNDGYRCSDYY